jgi:hypothetical protein
MAQTLDKPLSLLVRYTRANIADNAPIYIVDPSLSGPAASKHTTPADLMGDGTTRTLTFDEVGRGKFSAGLAVDGPIKSPVTRRPVMTADLVLTATDSAYQHLDPGATDRNVIMAPIADIEVGHTVYLRNIGNAFQLYALRDDGITEIVQIGVSGYVKIIWDGVEWLAY